MDEFIRAILPIRKINKHCSDREHTVSSSTFSEESTTDGHEGLLWPFVEPVDARRVRDGREFPSSVAQS